MRYWDAFVNGERSHGPRDGFDEASNNTVQEIHRRYVAQPADPAFSATLLSRLTTSHMGAVLQQSGPLRAVDAQSHAANGRAQRISPRASERRQSAISGRLVFAATAVTLLVLAGVLVGFVALSSGGDEDPRSIPAVVDGTPIATPIPDLVSQTLFEKQFDAGALRVTDDDFLVWNRYSLAPGLALAYPNACGAPKIVISFVESGAYTVRAEGSLEVSRANGELETIPGGEEVVLAAGDSLLYLNETGDRFTGFRNQGPEPLVVTEAVWRLNECVEGPPENMDVIWDSYDYAPALDSGRPITITLRRVTAAPGIVLSEEGPSGVGWLPASARAQERIYVDSGNLEFIQNGVNEMGTPTTQSVYQYPEGRLGVGGTFTLDLDMAPAETSLFLDNNDEGPLVITVFTVAYADDEPALVTPSVADS
jgi:hypothetical protein